MEQKPHNDNLNASFEPQGTYCPYKHKKVLKKQPLEQLRQHVEKNTTDFGNFIITTAVEVAKGQKEDKTLFYDITTAEDETNSSLKNSLVHYLPTAQIPKNIVIRIDGEETKTSVNPIYVSSDSKSNNNNLSISDNEEVVVTLSDLLATYACACGNRDDGFDILDLSLEEQINALATASNNNSQALKGWKKCLKELLDNAEKNKDKQKDVQRYVNATQAILKDPSNTASFNEMVGELQEKAARDPKIKRILEAVVLLFIMLTLGALLATTALINPLLTLSIIGLAFVLLAANFCNTPTDEGRLSMGISHILGERGFFQSKKYAEKAQELLGTINPPDSSQNSTPASLGILSPVYIATTPTK